MEDNKRILVIGGTVFLSKAVAIQLIKDGHQVDILTRGKHKLDYTGLNEHIICDRRDGAALTKAMKGKNYDVILDICAYTPADVKNILKSIDIHKIKKYILVSTCSIYKLESMPLHEESERVTEEYSRYGWNKLMAERELLASGVANHIIVRPTYIYGENNNLNREQSLFEAIIEERNIYMRKQDCIVNLIYINDLVKIFSSLVKDDRYENIELDIASSEKVSFLDIIQEAEKNICKKAIITNDKKGSSNYVFPLLPMSITIDNKKFKNIFGEFKFTPFSKGLCNTYKLYNKIK